MKNVIKQLQLQAKEYAKFLKKEDAMMNRLLKKWQKKNPNISKMISKRRLPIEKKLAEYEQAIAILKQHKTTT